MKDFEIDLSKDFSIIYGKNNIGKSYAVSVVYLILKKIASYTEN
ncbi:MAG: ATP-binding protein [Desulfobacteraceae bacterium]|nr:ATP-binding protein [Desulfobacteraceae bacterium]